MCSLQPSNPDATDDRPVIIIAGYGPSIGEATARQFGLEGYAVACLGRTKAKLKAGVERLLATSGVVVARGFEVDCSDAHAVINVVTEDIRPMGRIMVVVWNAASYAGPDLLMTGLDPTSVFHEIVGLAGVGLLAMVQATKDDLMAAHGSVLITGGGLSSYDLAVNQVAANNGWDGLALCKSMQRKMAGLLHARLQIEGIFVGSVIISGPVRVGGGQHDGSTNPTDVAEAFWAMHVDRDQSEIHLGSLNPLIAKTAEDTSTP